MGLFKRKPKLKETTTTPGGSKRLSPDGLRIVEFPAPVTQLLRLYGVGGSYSQIYAHQPNVRTAVETIAREAAELSLKMYYKDDRGDDKPSTRVEVDDHRMARLLAEPTPGESTYRFWHDLFADIEVYDIAYWLKIRERGVPAALRRIPPPNITMIRDPRTYNVIEYRTAWGTSIPPRDLMVFWGYDPATDHGAVSPMESIRRIIAEDIAAGADREGRWRNSARKDGIIQRATDSRDMSDEAKESFLLDVEDALAGPSGSGRPLMLEPGMTWNDVQWSPREMEYLNARKLTRTEVAAHFHLPPAMIAAAANNAEADADTLRYFYQSSLPPRLARVESEIEAQLLPEFELIPSNRRLFYVRFNLDEKLRGSFEERAAILATTVGGPLATVNEGRARLDLPATDNPLDDMIYTPLNSLRGGGEQASPQNPVETPADDIEPAGVTPTPTPREASFDPNEWLTKADEQQQRKLAATEQAMFLRETRARYEERANIVFRKTFERQRKAVKQQASLDLPRWNKELADDLFGLLYQAADVVGDYMAKFVEGAWDGARTANFIRARAENIASAVNEESAVRLNAGTEADEVFNDERAFLNAQRAATWVTSWAQMEVAEQNGDLGTDRVF